MFDALTDKFNSVFRTLSGKGRISEENVRQAMREVRTALLEADVNLKVVKDFTEAVIQKAIGQEVIKSLQPGQLMVKIVHDELLALLGPVDTNIYFVQPGPTVIMMCGLQGSGKTTTCGKLAKYLLGKGHHPLLAAADLQRPAAVEQLRVLGEQVGVPVYTDNSRIAPHGQVNKGAAVTVCRAAIAQAKTTGRDVVILHSGVGMTSATARAGEFLESHSPTAWIAAGFGGALSAELKVGEIVTARNFSDGALLGAVAALPAHTGTLITTRRVVETAEEKNDLGRHTGAMVVDMETAAIHRLCVARGVPVLAIRAISDTAGQDLPVPTSIWFDKKRQTPRPVPLLLHLVAHPSRITPFFRFVRGVGVARARLTDFLLAALAALPPT